MTAFWGNSIGLGSIFLCIFDVAPNLECTLRMHSGIAFKAALTIVKRSHAEARTHVLRPQRQRKIKR